MYIGENVPCGKKQELNTFVVISYLKYAALDVNQEKTTAILKFLNLRNILGYIKSLKVQ